MILILVMSAYMLNPSFEVKDPVLPHGALKIEF
jgi:hypothetical protein